MDRHRIIEESERRSGRQSARKGVLVFVPNAEPEARIGWRALFEAVRRDRWIHLAVIIGFCALGAASAFIPKRVYRAQSVLLRVSNSEQGDAMSALQGSSLGGLAGLAGINLEANDDFRKESLALLTSRDFTVRFIQEENLMPLLYESQWDAERARWRTNDPGKVPTIDDALDLFDHGVRTVTEDRRNGLTLVTIEWPDRFLAAKWANLLVARANAELRRRTIEDSEKKLEFLNRKLPETSVREIQQTLYRLMETELRKITFASVREEYAFRVIDSARVPMAKKPVRPRRSLSLLLGFSVAMMVCSWIAWLRARARASVETERRD